MCVLASIREFCQSDLALKACQETHRHACEPSLVRRNTSYASLVRMMQQDELDILELSTGGFLRKSTVKTQCALKPELVLAAVQAAVAEFEPLDPVDALLKLIKKHLRQKRTSDVVKVSHISAVPRGMSEYDIPRANEFITSTATAWMEIQKELSACRRVHAETKKALDLARVACLDAPGVRDYMKQECPDGKSVRIQGHDSNFTLRYSESTRRRPIREGQVQEAIAHAVTLLPGGPVDAAALASVIMATALEKAGNQSSDSFTLCARTGRKRAADCTK